ncbi:hypothetical protein AKJ48_03275 [candidate division MSBL1 archaeon SCGC-AAA261O19]|uniref:Prepilin type IV endopeptidase peptidase domain-containing protein n=1 Tax=candidate division MSBL1 archaeon SCGC-AAA261O19 TaxID=1698277 RepID=A0A133VCL6_9EURY|nr:hypothetical protein AKJ48_03275 [candidate division MSBL1 archaeon SCGC-AAA261O19]
MWLELIPAGLALGAVIIANYTDLKDRIIPNKLTFSLIGFGIVFYLAFGISSGEFVRAFYGVIGASIAFGIGYVMWLTGGWAGGDVKLFTALGALLPAYEAPYLAPPYSVNYPLFPLTILFNGIIAAIPFLLIYVAVSRAMGRGAFYETVKISELKEGMIPAEIIYEKNGKIKRYDSGYFGFLSRAFGTPEWDRQLANPDRAAGISRYYVGVLRRMVREGKLKDRIKIKKGMPFAPALGAGVFIGIFYGGLYWGLLTLLA